MKLHNLTFENIWINFYPASAITGAGISILNQKRAQALTRRAFFAPNVLWWAVWEHLRVRRFSFGGNANEIQPATLMISINRGSSQIQKRSFTMTNLSIGTTSIRQIDGLYNLNDLHKVSGNAEKHKPHKFLRSVQAQELIEEISKGPDLSLSNNDPVKTVKGTKGGSFACKELVYAYAMWISAKFNLAVIRAFDAMQSPPVQPALPSHPELAARQVVGFDASVLQPIESDNQLWLTSADIAAGLGYVNAAAIRKLHSRHKKHFDHTATRVLKLKRGGRGLRVFSKKGCQLLSQFSGSDNALALFNWASDLPGESLPMLVAPETADVPSNALALVAVDLETDEQNIVDTVASIVAAHKQSGEPCTVTLRLDRSEPPLIKTMDGPVTCFENSELLTFVKYYQKKIKISLEKTDALNAFLKAGSFINPEEIRA